jgi:integrase
MPKLDLSDRFIATLKAKKKPVDYFDSKTTGLGLRISPTGLKAWSVMFTLPGTEKRARLSLGTYPATPLATARTKALEARSKVEAGEDPRIEPMLHDGPAPEGAAVTVAMLAENYIERHGRQIKTGKDLARRLRVDVLPIIGNVRLADLHRRDVHRVLDAINDRGSPQAAAKAFGDMRAMLKWAVQRGDLDADPMAAMETPEASKPRERFLTEEEIAALWPAFPAPVALALKLALVTGQRIGEVTGITLDEIDFAKALWNLPAERSKNGSAHTVPLSPMALDLIAQARRTAIGDRLFPGLNSMKVGQQLIRYRDRLPVSDWAAHDLRRTVCTHLAMLRVSPLVIGACVNHRGTTKSGVTMSTYVRYDYAKEKREALELWADRLRAIVAGDAARVIPMNRNVR